MGLILFGVFILLLVLGVPVAFSICTAAGVTVLSGLGQGKLLILIQRMFEACNSFSLIAVPFFILAGDLLSKGKISKLLVEFCESLLGVLRGGLSVVSVLAGMFFAAISGSGAATTAAVGGTLVPELKRRGYPEAEAAALIAAAGTIGVVIPPSVPMVLYAVIAEESVNRLFKAGFLPGVLMGIALIGIALVQAYKNQYPKGTGFSVRNIARSFFRAIPGILMPLIILGGIFSGYFTPSEAAAVAVVYAVLVSAFIYRDLTLKGLFEIMKGSARTSAVIMIIIACSGPFGWVLANWKIPESIANRLLRPLRLGAGKLENSGVDRQRRALHLPEQVYHHDADLRHHPDRRRLYGDLLRHHHPHAGVSAAGAGAGRFHAALRHSVCRRHCHRHDHASGRHQPVCGDRDYRPAD